MKKIIFAAVVAVVLSACTQKTEPSPSATAKSASTPKPAMTTTASPSGMMQDSMGTDSAMKKYTFKLATQNNSGRMGTATLEEVSGKVKVTVDLTESTKSSTVAEPAHIHLGKCPTPGDVKYPLTSVSANKSVTTIDTTLAKLMLEKELSINVHKSAADAKTYVACGDLNFKTSPSASAKSSASVKASATAKPSPTAAQ